MNLYKVMATSHLGMGSLWTQDSLEAWLAQQRGQSQGPRNLCSSTPGEVHSGIGNLGATCYLNSSLQILALLSSRLTPDSRKPAYVEPRQLLTDILGKLATKTLTDADIKKVCGDFLSKSVADLTGLSGDLIRQHQDASEVLTKFLGLYLPSLSIRTSVIPNRGTYKGQDFTKSEAQSIVSVPLTGVADGTLFSALVLREYGINQAGEQMTGKNQFVPVEGAPSVDAVKKHFLVPTGNSDGIVFFDLKRFTYNRLLNRREKISTPVSVDSRFVMPVGDAMVQFDLVGGIIHDGTAHGGHYVSFAQHDGQPGYTVFDDSGVSHVAQPSDVPGINTGGYVVAYRMTPASQSFA